MVERVSSTIKEKVRQKAREGISIAAIEILSRLPERGLEAILNKAKEKACEGIRRFHTGTQRELEEKELFMEKFLQMAKNALPRLSPNVRKRLALNMFARVVNASETVRKDFYERKGYLPPFLLVISPTMRCNLNCYGCYAGEYSKKDDLPFEEVDRILTEAKEKLGIHFITISGGEPFIREDIYDIFAKHPDIYFQVYTHGLLIDAEKLAELGNASPAISVEGFREETDKRRGKGHFDKVVAKMQELKEAGVLFGFSATATRENNELIVSDEFIDFYIEQGCSFGWYFNYIPIGRCPSTDLMPTPEQRRYRIQRLHEIRKTKPILVADFWNDGHLVGGCMAGGQKYLHITCKGDVEPCVFVHFAVDNIKNKSLEEILDSPFFKEIRSRQPFSPNHFAPCMIIDNPHILREVVEKCGAYPTHPGAETIIQGEIARYLDSYSQQYHGITDKMWEELFVKKEESAQ